MSDSAIFEAGKVLDEFNSSEGIYDPVDWKGYEAFELIWEPYEG